MSWIVTDLQRLYEQTFYSKPYVINSKPSEDVRTNRASALKEQYNGKEVWLPCEFSELGRITNENGERVFGFSSLKLPYATVSIEGSNNWIETPLNGRAGTVKELYNTGDYNISVKGFLIDEANRLWPEDQINYLRHIKESGVAVSFNNALTDIFLIDIGNLVVVKKLTLHEVTGGRIHVRPFTMELVSDNIYNLIVD
ncbi:DUF6046 domain-containing protein [Chryseosolibacter indicus]|uniref:DUF6046 domain-containing protein n=1 Tax=Chryseosolibacter indicus TaxID=2782351 RepID=A0ABS5VSI0_9BACT|nr:DUF6046 domain-containing protein [Chryseosolibacter indicus]MBT1702961.1 hypothetical protein [Chryseosolibacter indicus]